MQTIGLEALTSELKAISLAQGVGRVSSIGSGSIRVSGLSDQAALGDLVELPNPRRGKSWGEIVGLNESEVIVLPSGSPDGLQINDPVLLLGAMNLYPDESWLGRVIDPFGKPLDGGAMLRGDQEYELQGKPLNPTDRRPLGHRLETGMKVFNTMLPIVSGQRIGLFAGSGIGKSTLLGRFALGIETDVVVLALIGERGREVREFVDRVLGEDGMKKSVVVAATSDTSPMERRRCAWAAMSIAEFLRDKGRQVLMLADSVTRFADAHREIAVAAGHDASLQGYPSSTVQLITSLCERAGPGVGNTGDITAVFSVLVAGSDMDGPIADTLRGVLDGHVILDRQIAERGRFPAIDVLRSVSRSLPGAASEAENGLIGQARKLLGVYERSEMMIQAGLYSQGADPEVDKAIKVYPKLDTFFSLMEANGVEESFSSLRKCF